MKLILLAGAILALSSPLVSEGKAPDRNFGLAYGLSSVLERTGFSNVLDKAFGISGRPKYLHYIAPIDKQLLAMLHESYLHLPPDVIVKMVAKLKDHLAQSIPMLEKFDPALVRELDQCIKSDMSNFVGGLRNGIRETDKFLTNGDITRSQKNALKNFQSFIKRYYRYVTSKPALNSPKCDLSKTLLAVLQIFEKAPKLRSVRRGLCKFFANNSTGRAYLHVLPTTKEYFLFNFRRTRKDMTKLALKRLGKSILRAPPVQAMMKHFAAVLSNETVTALVTVFKKHGMAILEEKLRLMLAITFRPKGTFTKLQDFLPYMRATIRAVREVPKLALLLAKNNKKKINIPAMIEEMKKPNAMKKSCLKAFQHLPKDILQRLEKRPHFRNDSVAYCSALEDFNRFFVYFPRGIATTFEMTARVFNVSASLVTAAKATFAAENIPFIGFTAENPNAFYKQILAKGAMHRMMRTTAGNASSLYPLILHRVNILNKIMFGASACTDYAPSGGHPK